MSNKQQSSTDDDYEELLADNSEVSLGKAVKRGAFDKPIKKVGGVDIIELANCKCNYCGDLHVMAYAPDGKIYVKTTKADPKSSITESEDEAI